MSKQNNIAGTRTFSHFIICETPLHAGGGKEIGYIDNVIQREKFTDIPIVNGESNRGALRSHFRQKDKSATDLLFGPESQANNDNAGLLSPNECQLLFFPVRCYKGTFAWVTSPLVLDRFVNKMKLHDSSFKLDFNYSISQHNQVYCNSTRLDVVDKKVILEGMILDRTELKVEGKDDFNVFFKNLIMKGHDLESLFAERCCIVHDDIFLHLVKNHTDVRTRNSIDPTTGTANDTGLFTIEYLPELSILHTLIGYQAEFKNGGKTEEAVGELFVEHKPVYYKLGGDKGVGKGILKLI